MCEDVGLLRAGFAQEMGVLIRTVSELLTDIGFAQDAIVSPTPATFAGLYFTEEGDSAERAISPFP